MKGIGAALALASLVLGAGGEARASAGSTFEGETSVLVIEVPVRVLLAGQPVRGLVAGDFEVYDEGQRRELVAFEVIDRGAADPKPQSLRPQPGTEAPGARARRYLLLFDLAYSSGASLDKALAASQSLVEEDLLPGDQVAVSFYSALRGLRLLVDFTADRERIGLALEAVGALLAREPLAAGQIYARLAAAAVPSGAPLATLEEVVAEAGIVVRADPWWPHRSVIRGLARSLSGVDSWYRDLPGEKTLVFLSHGFPSGFLTGRGSAGTLNEVEGVFRAFRSAGWTIQAVNIGGLGARSGLDTLFLLAHETGGEAFENFNDIGEAFDRMLRRTSVTYVLAFDASDVRRDGYFRRLRVRLREGPAGARLVHRPGYYPSGFSPGSAGQADRP